MSTNPEPLCTIVGLLLSLMKDLWHRDAVQIGKTNLQICSLRPEMNVGAVFSATLLFRKVQREHANQDPSLIIHGLLVVLYLAEEGSRYFYHVFDDKTGSCLGIEKWLFLGIVPLSGDRGRYSEAKMLFGNPERVPFFQPSLKGCNHVFRWFEVIER